MLQLHTHSYWIYTLIPLFCWSSCLRRFGLLPSYWVPATDAPGSQADHLKEIVPDGIVDEINPYINNDLFQKTTYLMFFKGPQGYI